MIHILLLFFLIPVCALADEAKCAITLVPKDSTFQHWSYDWHHEYDGFLAQVEVQFTPPFRSKMEYGACSVSNPKQQWRFLAWGGDELNSELWQIKQGGSFGGGLIFSSRDEKAMDNLGDGTYLFAVIVDGIRCSNVIRVTIQHDYDPKKQPPLRVFAIQPRAGNAIQEVGVWIVPRAPDKELTNFAAVLTELSIDGQWHKPTPQPWDGMVFPLPAGVSSIVATPFKGSDAPYVPVDFYSPSVAPFQHAKVQARLFGYTSEITELSFDPSDSQLFDQRFGLQ